MTNTNHADHRLPGGWRLADHPKHGRVLVVRIFRDKAIYATPAEALGIHTHVSLLSDLTFVDMTEDKGREWGGKEWAEADARTWRINGYPTRIVRRYVTNEEEA